MGWPCRRCRAYGRRRARVPDLRSSHIDLAALQWAGSSGAAVTAADGRVSGFRFALRWDLWALMPGYTLGLLTACYLGRRVFWTAGMYSLAKVGIGVSIAVGVLSAVQDLLLLAALRDGLHGNWISAPPRACRSPGSVACSSRPL